MYRINILITACIALCGASLFLVGCNNTHSTTTETKDIANEVNDSIRNKEAREDSIKMAEALMLQSKVDNIVFAAAETEPVVSLEREDAADDPAIWYNHENPSKSVIIGTNKKSGLHVYSLLGEELFFLPCGETNNVDVRGNIVAASNRSDSTITVVRYNPEDHSLVELNNGRIKSSVNEVYGFCLYQNENDLYAIVNGKDGNIEQWLLNIDGDSLTAELKRNLKVNSQPEGMIADDEEGYLYVGIEEDAIYRFSAFADADTVATLINGSSAADNPSIAYDIEGLALAKENGKTLLIASIQGSFSYAVFDVTNPDETSYIKSFVIHSDKFDGVEETDGLEISVLPFNEMFPEGMLVVQDGFNYDGEEFLNQNFKYISWKDVKSLLINRDVSR